MQINIENLVSISEANQNFSKVARMVDTNGTAVILKNNTPKYVLVDYQSLIKEEQA
ncbi:TPA: type II toxin-antitoxin system Phd/YefM family antitoxin, partial [Streptococcus suis]